MSMRDDIVAGTRAAVQLLAGGSAPESWAWAANQGEPGTRNNLGSWQPLVARQADRSVRDEYDAQMGGIVRRERLVLSVAQADVPPVGSIIRDPAGQFWSVDAQPAAGSGIARLELLRVLGMIQTADRGGSV